MHLFDTPRPRSIRVLALLWQQIRMSSRWQLNGKTVVINVGNEDLPSLFHRAGFKRCRL
jgi:hypothetical protein